MKKVFSSIGKALAYFLTYLGGQLIVTFIMSAIMSVKCMSPSGELDIEEYMQLVGENTPLILIVSGAITLLTYFIVTLVRKKNMFKEISLHKMSFKGVFSVVFMGLSFNFIVMLVMSSLPFPEAMMENYETTSSLVVGTSGVLAWISTVLMAPIVEEVVFRGFVYSRLKEGTGMIAAVIVTSLLFGVVHGTVIWAAYAFVISLAFIFVRERFYSLWASILFHVAFNFVGMAMSTWTAFFEGLNPIVVLVCSVVVFVANFVWFIKLTKKEKPTLDTSIAVSC